MYGPALAEEYVALSVDSAGSTPEIGLSSGFGAGSGLKIHRAGYPVVGLTSDGVFDNPSWWISPS